MNSAIQSKFVMLKKWLFFRKKTLILYQLWDHSLIYIMYLALSNRPCQKETPMCPDFRELRSLVWRGGCQWSMYGAWWDMASNWLRCALLVIRTIGLSDKNVGDSSHALYCGLMWAVWISIVFERSLTAPWHIYKYLPLGLWKETMKQSMPESYRYRVFRGFSVVWLFIIS